MGKHTNRNMILVIGEILYDLFPSYKRIGGAPFNFAFHLKKLGFDVRFVSRVGRDDLGRGILAFIQSHGFDPADIQRDDNFPTGQVDVTMAKDGSHSFSIIKDTAYDHIEYDGRLKKLCRSAPQLAYFGTLVQRTADGHKMVRTVLDSLPPDTQKFCDINLRPGCWTRAVLNQSMARADILKLSQEELDVLIPDKALSLEHRAAALLNAPGPALIILTRGKKGGLWASSRGSIDTPQIQSQVLNPVDTVDTVGAGDAYAAMAAAARLSGLSDRKAMVLAHEFAAGICNIKGALPRDPSFYSGFSMIHDMTDNKRPI